MTRPAGTFRLTPQLIAAHSGSQVVCLMDGAIGQSFRLHAARPDARTNRRVFADSRGIRAGGVVIDPTGEVEGEGDENAEPANLTIVQLSGIIEQRAGYQSECGGWTDGHDSIAERMIEALTETDVMLVIDSPGGAHAGLEQAVARVMREKEEHGRRVTVYINELCGSAAYWWAACVGDEIYAPPSGLVGSIGARAAHGSESRALARAGVDVTFFVWPGAGKIAFAPELPLSDLGKQRGERDVAIAGESFAAAVGARRGMTREEIVELDADVLCGDAAIDAKILDGVASYEDVLSYCVTLAESIGDPEMSQATNQTIAHAPKGLRAEGDEKPESEEAEEKPKGMEPDAICKACGHQQETDAKYCDQCGDSMEAQPLPEDEEDEPEKEDEADDKPEPKERASVPPPGVPGGKKEDRAIPAARSTAGALATMLGLRKGASDLAVKTALVRKLRVVDYVAKLTGSADESEMLGGLTAIAEDARESGRLRAGLSKLRAKSDAKERIDLLVSLSAANLPDYPRGNLLVDEVGDNGRITATVPAPAYAEMRISTLRGLVKAKLAHAAPAAAKSPYVAEPDAAAAKASTFAYKVDQAKTNPVVANVVKNGVDPTIAAGIFAREFGGKS